MPIGGQFTSGTSIGGVQSFFTSGSASLLTLQDNNIQTTPTDALQLFNTTAATSGVPVQDSPSVHFQGSSWNTSSIASNTIDFRMFVLPGSGSSTYGSLTLLAQNNGGGYNQIAAFDSLGDFKPGGSIQAGSGTVISWNSDTGISRGSAGVVAVGTGLAGSAAGTLNAAGYQAGGTAGVTAGSFTAITAITSKAGIVTQLTGSSDERLKNSTPYTGGLNEILAITPASYYWNEKGVEHTGLSGKQQFVGFIAQDVQKAIPQAITATEQSKDGSETYLSLDDRPIIAALVNAIKELTARIKVLEARG